MTHPVTQQGSTVGIDWLELDLYSPKALRQIRDHACMPIASLESVMGRKGILPYLEEGAVDVCIMYAPGNIARVFTATPAPNP